MRWNLHFLNPRLHNIAQKIGLIITLSLLLGLVVAHNPFRGYETSYVMAGWAGLPPARVEINFLDWRSYGALLQAVDHVRDWLSFSLLTLLFGIAWLWIFQTTILKKPPVTSSTDSAHSNNERTKP